MDSRRFTVSFCIHSHCPQKFFRHYQTEVTTRSSLKEELLFKDAGQYSRGHKSRGQHTPLQGKVQKVHSLEWKNGPCFYSCHNPEAALRKKKKIWRTNTYKKNNVNALKALKLVNKTRIPATYKRKLTVCPQTMQNVLKETPASFFKYYSYST